MGWINKACCDVCGAEKKIANKWLLVRQEDGLFSGEPPLRFSIWHWNDELALSDDIQLICGESCLLKRLQPFLDSRTNPSTIPTNEGSNNSDANTVEPNPFHHCPQGSILP